jgi:hypothetical protein
VTLKFADLNPVGRAIIVVVAALTFAVAGVAFATSYGALYAWIRDTHLYSERLTRAWPLLLDAAFVIAQLAAILGGILRGSRGWPIATMLLSGSLTIWFNVQHAGADPGRRLAAALPPVLMMLAFEIDVQIVRWVMRALGRPMDTATPLPPGMLPAPSQLPSPGVVPGALYRPDGAPSGMVPPVVGPPPPAVPAAWWPYGQMPSPTSSEKPQNGQAGMGGSGLHGGGDQAEVTKRQQVEAYLARLGSDQVDRLTARQLAADLTDQGMDVSERYVARLFDQWNATRRHASAPRKRGSGPRPPRR